MTYDVIVIGAGIGGLGCAAKLAKHGKKVLVLEKDRHIGGTSYLFKRKGYSFPMGPLSFSFPGLVREFLLETGVGTPLEFKRNHFQLISPSLSIIFSRPFKDIKEELKKTFIREQKRLDAFFPELEELVSLTSDIHLWHPDYRLGNKRTEKAESGAGLDKKIARIREMSQTPCRETLERYFSDRRLINFLGSQGTSPPEMSLLNLAFMWNVMCREGVWFPSCGIHGLSDLLAGIVLSNGGEVKLGTPAAKIIISEGKAAGVRSADGAAFFSEWVVSNADYKKTFLELSDPQDIPPDFLDTIAGVPYTGSELCVYLGVDPLRVDLSRINAQHLFYRHKEEAGVDILSDLEDFENREFEVCLWSANAPGLGPQGKESLVLRVDFPYDHFSRFRTGEKRRREDYQAYKIQLAQNLIRAAEHILPGLTSSIEVMETSTPLTYEDWGHRYRGSIAGWTWSADYERAFGGKLLIETPIEHLLMAGIYAASELFLGGVPTALQTANLAADLVLS